MLASVPAEAGRWGRMPPVLLCPPWRWGTAATVKPVTAILHSEDGELISVADSLEFFRNRGLPESAAIVVGNGHRLAAAIGKILMTCWHGNPR
jgi:hypothetical protein